LLVGTGVPGKSVERVAADVVALLDRSHRIVPDHAELVSIEGLGPAKAATILAGLELARRLLLPGRHKIRMPVDLLPLVDRYIDRKQEHFLVATLNGAHEAVAVHVVTKGLVNRTIIHPREVFALAITDRAAAVMLAHNHPSGALEPSDEDRDVTRRLVSAGRTIGIPVLDHIIFSDRGYYSFLEDGEL
jgi:DNA repair protein RadC